MSIWKLLKAYVRDFEDANKATFSNEAWQRIKQLEADIEREWSRREREIHDMYRKHGNRGTDTAQN